MLQLMLGLSAPCVNKHLLSWHCKIKSLSPRDRSGNPLPPQLEMTLPSEALAASEIGAGRTTCQHHWHPFYRANSVLVALESEHETHLSPRNRKVQDISFQVEDQPKPNGHSGPWKAPFLSLDSQEMPPFPGCSHCFLQSTQLHQSFNLLLLLLASKIRTIPATSNWPGRKTENLTHINLGSSLYLPLRRGK